MSRMPGHLLVINAGSSSLKFCVYERGRSGWEASAKGQIEGIGTKPHLVAKDGAGRVIEDQSLGASVRDGRSALDALTPWLRGRFAGAPVLGVGHRVVHAGGGGATRTPDDAQAPAPGREEDVTHDEPRVSDSRRADDEARRTRLFCAVSWVPTERMGQRGDAPYRG